jgi:hypothetical protein
MSLEIEARITSSQGQLLLIAWFEGSSAARLVMTGPDGEREEIQINKISASLQDDVVEVLRESIMPEAKSPTGLTAKLQVNTERQRVGRAVHLGGRQTQADQLCTKLIAMASLMAQDAGVKRSLAVVKQHLGS